MQKSTTWQAETRHRSPPKVSVHRHRVMILREILPADGMFAALIMIGNSALPAGSLCKCYISFASRRKGAHLRFAGVARSSGWVRRAQQIAVTMAMDQVLSRP